ncbi:MAG: hypothetical protein ACP5P7_03920, partial [Sulfurihydrogenibium sp.]
KIERKKIETKICLYIKKGIDLRQNFLCITKSKVLQKRGRKGEEIFTKKGRNIPKKRKKYSRERGRNIPEKGKKTTSILPFFFNNSSKIRKLKKWLRKRS